MAATRVSGTLCSEAKQKGNSVVTYLQLDNGSRKLLEVDVALTSGINASSYDRAEIFYPKDAKVVVKPIRVDAPNLYVPSPAGVVFKGVAGASEELDPDKLRTLGNDAFNKGQLLLAELYYRECVAKCDHNNPIHVHQMVLALSNSGQVCLMLRRYDEAVVYAKQALEMDPKHIKSMLRISKALIAVQEYGKALKWIMEAKTIQETDATSEVFAKMLEELETRCRTLFEQSIYGSHDISAYLGSGFQSVFIPKLLSDYVGPVKIQMTRDGKGRGLFVTRDVKMGELLLVSNPVGFVHLKPGMTDLNMNFQQMNEDLMEIVTECIRACRGSSRLLHQLVSLMSISAVPDLTLFRPNASLASPCGDLLSNVTLLKGMVTQNGFFQRPPYGLKGSYGLWVLPGFINHSCLPNVTNVSIGSCTFVRASRDLKAGEEMLDAYNDVLGPWLYSRKEKCALVGFECKCPRCTLECKLSSSLKHCLPQLPDAAFRLEQLLNNGSASMLSNKEKAWIRGSYFRDYASARLRNCPVAVSREELMQIISDMAPGRPTTMLSICLLSVDCKLKDGHKLELSETAKTIFRQQCIGCFGEQRGEVIDKVLDFFQSYHDLAMLVAQGLQYDTIPAQKQLRSSS